MPVRPTERAPAAEREPSDQIAEDDARSQRRRLSAADSAGSITFDGWERISTWSAPLEALTAARPSVRTVPPVGVAPVVHPFSLHLPRI